MKIEDLDIEFETRQYEELVEFYQKLFDKKPISSRRDKSYFELNGTSIGIIRIKGDDQNQNKPQKLSLVVKEIEQTTKYLTATGIKYSIRNQNGEIAVFIKDPDKNSVIIKSKKESAKLTSKEIEGFLPKIDFSLRRLLMRFPYVVLISVALSPIMLYLGLTSASKTESIVNKAVNNPLNKFDDYVIKTHRPIFMNYYNKISRYTGTQNLFDKYSESMKNGMYKGNVKIEKQRVLNAMKKSKSNDYNEANELRTKLNDSNYTLYKLSEDLGDEKITEQLNIYRDGYSGNWKYFHSPDDKPDNLSEAQMKLNEAWYALDSIHTLSTKK